MICLNDIYKAQDDIEELKRLISGIGIDQFNDFVTSEWGVLGSTAKIYEVSFLKGTSEEIAKYAGVQGQLVYNTTNKTLCLMDGITLGGIPIVGSGTNVDLSNYYTKAETEAKIAQLVNAAPDALNTLKELADALGNDPNFATTILSKISEKAEKVHVHKVADITDFPVSMPASGGNADSIGGKYPLDFFSSKGGIVDGDVRAMGDVYTKQTMQFKSQQVSREKLTRNRAIGVATVYYTSTDAGKIIEFDNVEDMTFGKNKVFHTGRKPVADDILFSDGQTFQYKFNSGLLTGPKGADGLPGATGPKGDNGDPLQIENSFNGGTTKALSAEKGKELNNGINVLKESNPIWNNGSGIGLVTINDSCDGIVKDLIVKGKTVGGYNTETGQSDSIVSSGESEGNKIIIKSCGKNLFDGEFEKGWLNTDGSLVTNENRYRSKNFMQVNPNSDYSISDVDYWRWEYDINKNFIKVSSTQVSNFRTSPSTNFILVSKATPLIGNEQFQIEQGTIATEYEEYKEDKKEILLPMQSGLKGDVTKIGVEDTIGYENGEVVQRVSKYTFTGNETIVTPSSNDTMILFSINNAFNDCVIKPNNTKILCNNFKSVYNYVSLELGCFLNSTSSTWSSVYFSIEKSKLETPDVAGFKKWLQSNPITVIYELETPVIHNIEKMTLDTYSGITYISQENNIKGEITLQAPGNKDASIISLKSKIDTVEENFDSQLAQMMIDMLKKDGSVELIDTLRLVGDWIGVRIANANGDRGFINISPRINGEVGLQLGVGNVDDTALDYPLIVTKDGVAPNTANNKSLGKPSIPWRDVWVGSAVKNPTLGSNKLTNGYFEQYGKVEITFNNSASASTTITLPETFPGAICEAFANMGNNSSDAAGFNVAASVDNRSRINIRIFRPSGSVTGTYVINWKAKGW